MAEVEVEAEEEDLMVQKTASQGRGKYHDGLTVIHHRHASLQELSAWVQSKVEVKQDVH